MDYKKIDSAYFMTIVFCMNIFFLKMSFIKFHSIFWLIAGSALFISGLTQGPFFVSLTRNLYLMSAGFLSSLILAKYYQKESPHKIFSNVFYFTVLCYLISNIITIPINPITYLQLNLPFNEFSLRHLTAGTMNFGLVFILWSILFRHKVSKDKESTHPYKMVTINSPRNTLTIEVEGKNGVVLLPIRSIMYFAAAGDYVEIDTLDNKTYLKRVTIRSLEQTLKHAGFIKLHRSYLINQNAIVSIEGASKGAYILIMKNNTRIKTSRKYEYVIKTMLENKP